MEVRKSFFSLFVLMLSCVAAFGAGNVGTTIFPATGKGEWGHYPSTFTVKADDRALYVDIVNPHPSVDQISCLKGSNPRTPIWEEECVELFILPEGAEEEAYYHIVVSAASKVHAIRGNKSLIHVETDFKRAEGRWSAKITVPYEYLGQNFKRGGKWKFNLLRTVRIQEAALEINSWSRLESGAHEPWNFGRMERKADGRVELIPASMPAIKCNVNNGGFEKGMAGWRQCRWVGGNYGDGHFSGGVVPGASGGIEGNAFLEIRGSNVGAPRNEGARMGFQGQPVKLAAGKYILRGYYQAFARGARVSPKQFATVYIAGGRQEIALNPSEYWREFECFFQLDAEKDVYPMLRLWDNGVVRFDAIRITEYREAAAEEKKVAALSTEMVVEGVKYQLLVGEIEKPGAKAAELQKKQGVVPFMRLPELLQQDSAPADHEIVSKIELCGLDGEKLIAFISLYGEGEYAVAMESGQGGMGIAPEWCRFFNVPFWLQRVDYTGNQIHWCAELLKPLQSGQRLKVQPEHIAINAIRWEIPAGTRPGIYSGTLVYAGKAEKIRIPVRITVGAQPSRPASEQALYGMYVSEKQVPQLYDYIRQSDVRTATFPVQLHCEKGADGKFRVNMDLAIKSIREYFAAGMEGPIPLEMTRLSTQLAKLLGLYEKMPKDSTYDSRDLICPMSDAEMPLELLKAYEEAILDMGRQLREAGLADKVMYYPVDEPTINAHRMYRARLEGSTIKRLIPGARVFMTAHDIERVKRLAQAGALDVVCLAFGMLRADNADWAARFYRMAKENNLEVWTYGASYFEKFMPAVALGICVARQDVGRMLLYVSYWDNVNVTDELGDMRGPLKRCATFHPAADRKGYVSTIQWEAVGQATRILRQIGAYRRKAASMDTAKRDAALAELNRRMADFQERDKVTMEQWNDFQWWIFRAITE